ncbi:MAG: hypothetical protein P8J50_18385 [Acidimicrobiales bacterium]|nr:hypothetical protein [Acidimicrobiales bacterium]
MNSEPELSRVAEADAAIQDDPSFAYENAEEGRVLKRAAAGPGNMLDWHVEHRPGEPTTLTFSKTTVDFKIEVVVAPSSLSPENLRARSITITPPTDDTLDPSVFGALRLRALLKEMTEDLHSPFLRYQLQSGQDPEWLDPFIDLPKPGRRGRPDVEYAIWADRYVLAVEQSGGKPLPLLMSQHPGHSEASLRAILNKARVRKLLGKSPPGKAGGQLLPRAIELLEQHSCPITSRGA